MGDKKEIGKLFRERLQDFEKAPAKTKWEDLELSLDKDRSSNQFRQMYLWITAIALLLVIPSASYFYIQSISEVQERTDIVANPESETNTTDTITNIKSVTLTENSKRPAQETKPFNQPIPKNDTQLAPLIDSMTSPRNITARSKEVVSWAGAKKLQSHNPANTIATDKQTVQLTTAKKETANALHADNSEARPTPNSFAQEKTADRFSKLESITNAMETLKNPETLHNQTFRGDSNSVTTTPYLPLSKKEVVFSKKTDRQTTSQEDDRKNITDQSWPLQKQTGSDSQKTSDTIKEKNIGLSITSSKKEAQEHKLTTSDSDTIISPSAQQKDRIRDENASSAIAKKDLITTTQDSLPLAQKKDTIGSTLKPLKRSPLRKNRIAGFHVFSTHLNLRNNRSISSTTTLVLPETGKTSIGLGGYIESGLTDRWSLRIGVNLTRLKSEINGLPVTDSLLSLLGRSGIRLFLDENAEGDEIELSNKISYIEVPLDFRYHWGNTSKLHPTLYGGLSFLYHQNSRFVVTSASRDIGSGDQPDVLRGNVALRFGVGATYTINRHLSLNFEPTFSHFLFRYKEQADYRPNYLSFQLGFSFRL